MPLVRVFLMTYRNFISPIELFEKLVLKYCLSPPIDSNESDFDFFKNRHQIPVRSLFVFNLFLISYFYYYYYY